MRFQSLLGLAALCVAGPASATTYTVSPTGSDSANGVSAPFLTLKRALSALRSGDTLVFRSGTYVGGGYLEVPNVTLRGEGTVILDGSSSTSRDGLTVSETSGVTLDNLKFRNCKRKGLFAALTQGLTIRNCEFSNNVSDGLLTGNCSDVLVENCVAANNGYHGIYLSQSGDRLRVLNNRSYGNPACGIQINAIQESPSASNPEQDSLSKDVQVVGNTIYGCGSKGGAAIHLMGVQNSLIANNLLYSNLAGGIGMWDDGAGASYACKNDRIYHNTILFAANQGRYGIMASAGCTGIEVANNIIAGGAGPAFSLKTTIRSNYNALSGSGLTASGLTSWQNSSGNDLNSLVGVPTLNANFHPAAGSTALDAGYPVLQADKDGAARPQGPNPDLGCYEEPYGGVTNPGNGNTGGGNTGGNTGGSGDPSGGNTGGGTTTNAETIYGDALRSGWKELGYRCSYKLTSTAPVAEGSKAVGLTLSGADGFLRFTGTGISLSGKSALKMLVHGGTAGGQQLYVRVCVNGTWQPSVALNSVGGAPLANAWTEYTIPLSTLKASTGSLTSIKIWAAGAQKPLSLDWLRLQ